jgi:hypothetical protein
MDCGARQVVIDYTVSHFEREVIMWGDRSFLAYPIS